MTALLRPEAQAMLLEFLGGIVSPQDLEGWLISYLDDEVADSERDALWEMRLLLVEYGEGIRPVDDARACARRLLSENAV